MNSQTILSNLKKELSLRGFSGTTYETYACALKGWLNHFEGKDHPTHISSAENKQYLEMLGRAKSQSSKKICLHALKFIYTHTYGQPNKLWGVKIEKWQKKVPVIQSQEEFAKMLSRIMDRKAYTVVSLIYSTGVRLMEACTIKVKDIDRKNMCIYIRCGKGGKDRRVPMEPALLQTLEEYWRELPARMRFSEYLFPGEKPGHYASSSTIYRIVKRSMGMHTHLLRHTFATHLYENGTDILALKDMLGHEELTSTQIYAHTSLPKMQQYATLLKNAGERNGAGRKAA